MLGSATLGVAVAGCLSTAGWSESDQPARTFGDVVEYRGVEVVPTDWTTIEEVTYRFESGEPETVVASNESTFLLTRIEVAFVGMQSGCCPAAGRRLLPSRTNGDVTGSDILVIADGLTTTPGPEEATVSRLEVGPHRLSSYEWSRRAVGAREPVHPGIGFVGWTVTEIQEGFDPADVRIRIRWGGSDAEDRELVDSFAWHYEGARVAVDRVDSLETDA